MSNLSLILIITSISESYVSLSECWCLFCVFTPYLSEFFVFHIKTLILLNLSNWYATSTGQWFLNSQDTLWISLLIECNTDSCFEYKIAGVNIYLYGHVILLAPMCVVVFNFLFVWYRMRVLAKHHVIC